MSNKRPTKAEMAARAARVAGGEQAAPAPAPEPAPEPVRSNAVSAARSRAVTAAPVRTDPVRTTVNLEPMEHRTLTRVRSTLAERSGLTTVAGAEVFRALLAELVEQAETDPEGPLMLQVVQRLQAAGGRRRS